jgi:hypothetical protein
MTTLPIPRYTGANCFTAQDYAGNIFNAYQANGSDFGFLVMIDPAGTAHNITPAVVQGRPCLDCNPSVGLWFVGNKETGSTHPPPRYKVPQYVPWPAGAQGAQGPSRPSGRGRRHPLPRAGRKRRRGTGVRSTAACWWTCRRCSAWRVPCAYLVRLCGQATAANVKVRAGSETAPYFLTLTTQAPNVRFDAQGWVPGPLVFVSTLDGLAQVWLQIVGRS